MNDEVFVRRGVPNRVLDKGVDQADHDDKKEPFQLPA